MTARSGKKKTAPKKTTRKKTAPGRAPGKAPGKAPSRTDIQKQRFLDAYATNANLTRSARLAQVGRRTVQRWRQEDPEFDQACREAIQTFLDSLYEIHDDLAMGLEPIYDSRGKPTGKYQRVEPNLKALHRRIEHLDPTFKQRHDVEHSGQVALSLRIVKTYTPEPSTENNR